MGNHLSALLKWSNTWGALGKRGNMISLGVVAVFLVYSLIPKGCWAPLQLLWPKTLIFHLLHPANWPKLKFFPVCKSDQKWGALICALTRFFIYIYIRLIRAVQGSRAWIIHFNWFFIKTVVFVEALNTADISGMFPEDLSRQEVTDGIRPLSWGLWKIRVFPWCSDWCFQ